jgi:long-chain acyl-CoA synthetase
VNRIWLENYPPGVPADVDVHAFPSVKAVLEHACVRFAALPAYSNLGSSISYAQLDAASRDFGAYLQHAYGFAKGDRVAIMLPNVLQYPVALFGILRAGLVAVNVNPQFTPAELEHQLKDSGAKAIVVLENFAHTVQAVLDRNPQWKLAVFTSQVGDMLPMVKEVATNLVVKYVKKMVPAWKIAGAIEFNAALRAGHEFELRDVTLGPADLAFLQYTGGTTGVAKGAMLTHGNLVANLQQVGAWIAQGLKEGEEVFVCPLPLYHVYALSSSLLFAKLGAHTILVTDPRNMEAFLHDLRRYRFTTMIGVNTLYRALLDAPGFADVDKSSLKVASSGGMAVQRVVAERWAKATGIPLVEGYGLTETSPVAISNPLAIEAWTGTIGMPIPSTEAAILDDDGRRLPVGEVGEICIRGPQVMAGYWMRPDETAQVFTSHGWFRTGDMGLMDERGWFRITDRKKDMIIVSGFKVFPNQIEDVVAMHPGVLEVGAIGVPDERSGEAVKIVVVRRDPALTAQALLEHCRNYLTAYKLPKIIEFSAEPLPKSSIGKILRRQLRGRSTAPPESALARQL